MYVEGETEGNSYCATYYPVHLLRLNSHFFTVLFLAIDKTQTSTLKVDQKGSRGESGGVYERELSTSTKCFGILLRERARQQNSREVTKM